MPALVACVALLLALLASVRPAEAQVECAPDLALRHAAEALLAQPGPPNGADVLEAARAAGSDVPVIDALVIRDGDPARRARFLDRTRARRDGELVCGEARAEERWLVLVAPRVGHLEPLGAGALRVELAAGWSAGRLYAEDAIGEVWETDAPDGARVELPADLVAPVRVQLVASGPGGPRPVAERMLVAAEEAPLEDAQDGPPRRVVAESDQPLAARLTTLRRGRELRDNRLLTRVATEHAEVLCRAGRVSHVSDEGDPEARLARAGLRARHVGEVVARAEDVGGAYAALLRSPSHRAALTDRRFTDAGIGQAHDAERRTCLVILLAAWPRPAPR